MTAQGIAAQRGETVKQGLDPKGKSPVAESDAPTTHRSRGASEMTARDETPDLRWFKHIDFTCRQCGKRAAGELMSYRNETYGLHCQRCADSRLKNSAKVRELESGK